MLPKSQRLNLKTSFRWVASGKSRATPTFKFFYRLGENEQPKIGVSLISAQFKKSTMRSSAKRICFKLAGEIYDQLPKNINLVIMPRAQILDTDFPILSKQFSDAISSFKID